ncbi:MAG TPA: hypothetical protein VMH28_28480 [Candidatus Acidoferrales bacterium]|nr:hypothetical protein [Candidatus Acidoferrales bacterium]
MKLSRQFDDEQQAKQTEMSLQAAGCRAWRKRAADGFWHVFWVVEGVEPA